MRHILSVLLFLFSYTWAQTDVYVIQLDQAIAVASEEWIDAGIEEAKALDAKLIIVELDTPGGFPGSTRAIIASMQQSPIPVAVLVTPQGAQAASAGTFIVYGADIAAMSPMTTIGAATPISLMGGPSQDKDKKQDGDKEEPPKEDKAPQPDARMKKVMNDILAFARSLAKSQGRSEEFIVKAVTEAKSISADEALAQGVIEYVAKDRTDLINQLNSKEAKVRGNNVSFNLDGAKTKIFEPSLRLRVLTVISDPTVTYLLLIGGIYGVLFELYSPGALFPGILGFLCLILAGYSLHLLPFNFAGVLLIVLGSILMIAELMVPSFGILGFGALIAFFLGAVFLFDSGGWVVGLSFATIGIVVALLTVTFLILGRMAIKAHRRTPFAGSEELVGTRAMCTKAISNYGEIRVNGERWTAFSNEKITKGQMVEIESVKGLTCHVRLSEDQEGEKSG